MEPKYKIGDSVWILDSYSNPQVHEVKIYGALPRIEVGYNLVGETLWTTGGDKSDWTKEQLEVWRSIPAEKREVSWRVKEWGYVIAKESIDIMVYGIGSNGEDLLKRFCHTIGESKLFPTKQDLINSL